MVQDFPRQRLADALVRKTCWFTAPGDGFDDFVQLFLGAKLPRTSARDNPLLSEEAKWHDPEYGLMLLCAWRLDDSQRVLTAWNDPSDSHGPMVRGLAQLHGETVEGIQVTAPAWDLDLKFSGRKTLRVFCDQTANAGGVRNWLVHGHAGLYLAVKQGCIWTDQRE